MVEEDNNMMPEDVSNVDQINKFVTGSDSEDNTDGIIEEKPIGVVEEKKVQEDYAEKKEPRKVENRKRIDKIQSKPATIIKSKNTHKHKTVEHKHEEPKQEKKTEKKMHLISKKIFSKNKKVENQPKEEPKPKKISKQDKDTRRDKKKSPVKNILLWVGIGLLVTILIIALVMLLWPNKQQPDTGNQTTNTVAATVNGEALYLQDIMTQYNNLNPVLQQMYTVESLLNKSIDDLLLYQESKRLEIKISEESIQKELDDIMIQNGMDKEQLEQALSTQGMTVEDATELIRKNLAIREMLNNTILQNIKVTETEIENYYDQNTEKFDIPEQVTIRHILVMVSANVSNESAKTKIESIKNELTAENFCELAAKYSEDPGSKDNCGEYTFGKGDFNNPEFENPSFDMDIGETSIIQTVFGYHLIKKMDAIPAHTQDLKDVYDDINSTLHDQTAQDKFDVLLEKLRDNAEIINYYTKVETDDLTNETVLVPLANLDDFAKCLTENNATLYGAYWCPHCEKQKEMFGDSIKYLNYVECAVEGQPQVQTKACTAADISGYPTWVINGKQYPGEQTMDRLEALTGCKR